MKRALPTSCDDDFLVDDVVQEIGRYLVRPAHYLALLMTCRATARALGAPHMRLEMARDYVEPWRLVKESFRNFPFVEKQTPELCLAAVQACGRMIRYVKRQTPAICLAAVQQEGGALFFVQERTPEIALAAVRQDGSAIRFVWKQTPELCLAAVQQNGGALFHIYERTYALSLAAVRQNPHAIGLVKEKWVEAIQRDIGT